MTTRRIGRYRLEQCLGQGGMGEVYKAYDERLGRWVALKTLPRHRQLKPEQREQLEREARSLAALNHPAIAQIFDIMTIGGRDYLVLEYVEGATLGQELAGGNPIPVSRALRLALEVAVGLDAAHQSGIIHRDLKAENVVVTPADQAKILDLGLARLASAEDQDDPDRGVTGLAGTLHAMSPEQVLNEEIDARSDLFALGTLLYQLLTGTHPFAATLPVETANRIVRDDPPPVTEVNPEVPAEVSALIRRLLAKDRDQRPNSAGEVAQVLRRHAERNDSPPPTEDGETAASPPGRRTRLVVAAIITTVAVIVASLTAARWWAGARRAEPVTVAITRPLLEEGIPAEPPWSTAAVAVRVAAVNALATLEGVYSLSFSEVNAAGDEPRQVAAATAADEVLTSSLSPAASGCLVTLSRISGSEQNNIWAATFEVPTDNLRLLSETVAAHLRQGYAERRSRKGSYSIVASPEDMSTYLELRQQMINPPPDVSWPGLLERFSALRASSPGLLVAYTDEASIARYLYQTTRSDEYLDHAKEVIRAARKIAPGDRRPLHSEVELALAINDREWAQQGIGALKRLDPTYLSLPVFEARLAEVNGDVATAIGLLEHAQQGRPSWRLLVLLSETERRHGFVEQARGHLQQALELVPDNQAVLAIMAELELMFGDVARAEELYLRLVFLSGQPNYLSSLGTAQLLLGRYREAVTNYQRALDRGSRHPVVILNLADCLSWLGQQDEARILYREAIDRIDSDGAGSNPFEMGLKSQCLLQLGHQDAALDVMQQALELAPRSPDVAYSAAILYAASGDQEAALASTERALALGISPAWFNLPWFAQLQQTTVFKELLQSHAAGEASP